jgi:hypothetical protein
MQLPRDMLDLMWDFAYNVRTKTHPLVDVAFLHDVQCSIPPIFLRPSIPASPIFDIKWEFLRDQEYCYSTLYIPNPYVLGNPYHPSNGLCEYVTPWAFTIYRVVQLLVGRAVKKELRTYPAILLRKCTRHYNSGIMYWNHMFQTFWSRDAFLNPESFVAENTADHELIKLVCFQLARAKFF